MNDFEWNETANTPEDSDTSAAHTPAADFESWSSPFTYQETIKKPRKERKSLGSRPWFLCLISVVLSTAICFGAFFAYLNLMPEQNRFISSDTPPSSSIPPEELPEGALSTAQIAEKVSPSVVGITSMVKSYTFFYNQETTAESSGSGIIISSDGYILTNNHVISGASSVQVKLNSGEAYDATLIGTDSETDLAVIKIDATGLTPAVLGDSDALVVGEKAVAIGNPLSLDLAGTVTEGIVSALNRTITVDGVDYNLLQTDAAINSGNSGGALVNQYGQVIGINSVKISSSGVEGLGFAIPINDAKPIINDLMNYGYVKGRPFIGVSLKELTRELAYYNNLPIDEGLYVVDITEGAAADLAGIRRGDIITACDGEKVTTVTELNEIRDRHKAGETVILSVNRNGEALEIELVLSEKKSTFIQD